MYTYRLNDSQFLTDMADGALLSRSSVHFSSVNMRDDDDDHDDDDDNGDGDGDRDVHPEHKIYRRSASKSSLRTVLSSVSHKLAHFKSASDFWGSLFNLTNNHHVSCSQLSFGPISSL